MGPSGRSRFPPRRKTRGDMERGSSRGSERNGVTCKWSDVVYIRVRMGAEREPTPSGNVIAAEPAGYVSPPAATRVGRD